MTAAQGGTAYRRIGARQARAIGMGSPDADFLADIAARELAARIGVVNRTFESVLDVCSTRLRGSNWLQEAAPNARIKNIGLGPCAAVPEPHAFGRNRYDLTVSVFGLHWCRNLRAVLKAIHNAMKPDGLFIAVLPGRGTLDELNQSMLAAESSLAGGAARRVDPFISLSDAGALLQSSGFALPVADIEKLTLRYANTNGLVEDLRTMGTAGIYSDTSKPLPRGIAVRLQSEYASRFADSDGRIRATVNLVYFAGWTPHVSQQQPAAPGSAQVSLADALKKS